AAPSRCRRMSFRPWRVDQPRSNRLEDVKPNLGPGEPPAPRLEAGVDLEVVCGERRKAGLNGRPCIIMAGGFHAPLAPRFPVEIQSMTQTAAQTQDETQDLHEDAIAAALARLKLLPPAQKARCHPLAGRD